RLRANAGAGVDNSAGPRGGETAIEHVAQHRGDRGDGEGVAHPLPPTARFRYSSKESRTAGSAGPLLDVAGGGTARISTRPIVTCTVGSERAEEVSGKARGATGARAGSSARAREMDLTRTTVGMCGRIFPVGPASVEAISESAGSGRGVGTPGSG